MKRFFPLTVSLASFLATTDVISAATYDWIGGTSTAWSTTANWSPAPPTFPVAGDTVLFGVNQAVTSATTDLGGSQGAGGTGNASAADSVFRYGTVGGTTAYTLQGGTVTIDDTYVDAFLVGSGVTLNLNAAVSTSTGGGSSGLYYNLSTNATFNVGAAAVSDGRVYIRPFADGVTATANIDAVNFMQDNRAFFGNKNVQADVTVNINADQTSNVGPLGGSWMIGETAPGSEAKMVVRNGASVDMNGRLALGGFTDNRGVGRLVIGDAATAGYWTNRSTTAGSGNWLQIVRNTGTTGIVDIVNGVFTGPTGGGFSDFIRELPYNPVANSLAEINIYTNGTFTTLVSWDKNTVGEGRINFYGGTLQAEAGIAPVIAADLLKVSLPVYVHDGGAVVDNNGEDITLSAGLLNPGGSTGGLSLVGSGSTTLNGANTFTGPTLVQQGTLGLDTGFSTLSSITVGDGAALGFKTGFPGTSPDVTVADGGTVRSLSTTAGTDMNVNSLTLGNTTTGGIFDVQFGAFANDSIAVAASGGLTINGGRINLFAEGTQNPFALLGTTTLFTYTGTLNGSVSDLVVNNPVAGFVYTFNNTGSSITLTIAVDASINQWAVDADGNWSAPGNWTLSVPNGVDATATFGAAISAPRTVNSDTAHTVGKIEFSNPNTYTIGGSGVITLDSSSNAAVSVSVGSHTIGAPVSLAADSEFSADDNQTLTIAGSVSGSGAFRVTTNNVGRVNILGTNSAPVTVDYGTVEISGSGQVTQPLTLAGGVTFFDSEANLGPNPGTPTPTQLLLDGGTLRSTGDATIDDPNRGITLGPGGGTFGSQTGPYTLTIANPITGSGSLTKTFSGQGTLVLTAANTYGGDTIIDYGEIMVGNGGTSGTLGAGPNVSILNGSFLTLNRSDVSSLTKNVTLGSGNGGVRNSTGNTLSLTGTIDFDGRQFFVDASSGNMTLSGANVLNFGRIIKSGNNALNLSGSMTAVASGAFGRIEIGEGTVGFTSGANWAIDDADASGQGLRVGTTAFTGAGAAAVISSGATVSVKGAVAGTVNGSLGTSITVDAGTLILNGVNSDVLNLHQGGSGTLADDLIINNGGIVTATDPSGRANIGYKGDANLTINNGTVSLNRAGFGRVGNTGGRVPDGTGAITLNAGSLNISNQFELMADASATPLRNNTVDLNGGTLRTVAMNCTHPAATVNFNFNGGTLVALGDALTGPGTLANFLAGVDIATVQFGGAIIDSGGFDMTITNDLQDGGGTLTKVGGGSLALNGNNAYFGDTIVSGGTLGGSGSVAGSVTVANGAGLAPGASVGTFTIGGNLTLGNSTLAIELDKDLGQSNDVVSVAGTLNYGSSTMVVANLGATPLAVGDTFVVFNKAGAGSVTVVPPPGVGMSFNESTGILTVDSVGVPDPGTLEYTVSGNVIEFSWTNIAAGLEFQTNPLSTGLSTNWAPYPDPSNPVSVTNDLSIPASFFRLSIP